PARRAKFLIAPSTTVPVHVDSVLAARDHTDAGLVDPIPDPPEPLPRRNGRLALEHCIIHPRLVAEAARFVRSRGQRQAVVANHDGRRPIATWVAGFQRFWN